MSILTPEMVQEGLRSLPEWKLEGKEIVRHYQFPDFVAAMIFVNQVAEKAEAAGHHPDIDIRYNKVKLALDKARYRAGDTMKVTVTPPQDGPGVLLVETDRLLYTRNIDAKAGATFDIPVTKDWERHDVHVVALVFRGGEATDKTTPARAMGIEHVAMDRNDRRIPLKLSAPAMMRRPCNS